MKNLDWFINRVGTRIYRDKVSCRCVICTQVEKDWLIVHDKAHAEYLHMCSWDMWIDYFDKTQ